MISETWQLNQQNLITFIMVDAGGNEVSGLGAGFILTISKNGNPIFAPSAGVKAEMANGFYSYLATVSEANTVGTISIIVTGVGCKQQNLEYVVKQRNPAAIEYTYIVTDNILNPIEGVEVWFTTDLAGHNIVWKGDTDAFGVAMDGQGNLPWLDAGTYYVWCQKTNFTFINPDLEVVS